MANMAIVCDIWALMWGMTANSQTSNEKIILLFADGSLELNVL